MAGFYSSDMNKVKAGHYGEWQEHVCPHLCFSAVIHGSREVN